MAKNNKDSITRTKSAIMSAATVAGAAGGHSTATTAGALAAGTAGAGKGTCLGYLCAKGAISKGALVAMAAHPGGLIFLGALAAIGGAYALCEMLSDE